MSGKQRKGAARAEPADGAGGAGKAPGKRTRTQDVPAVGTQGPSSRRLIAHPHPARFAPTEIGQARYLEMVVANVSEEPVDFFDFLETVLVARDGIERPSGDFAVVGGATTGEPLTPHQEVPVTVAFTPQASDARDLTPRRTTVRKTQFAVIDQEGAAAGTLVLEGRARPPSADTLDEDEVGEVTAAARTTRQRPPPPRSYDDMRRHLMAAAELMKTSERNEARELVDEVRERMYERLRYDQVLQAARRFGFGTQGATFLVAQANDEIVGASRRLSTTWAVDFDKMLSAFQAAKEPIQFTLGEIDDAPTLRAIHEATPAVMAGEAAAEIGETVVDVFTDAAFAAGFGVGVLEGTGGAIKDLATGVADVLELAFDIAKELITGGLVGVARHIASKLSEFFDKAPEALAAMGASFQANWNAPGSFERGNFRGEVIGYVATQIAIIIISGGAAVEGVAFAAMSRWGQLVAVIQKLDAAGDLIAWAAKARRSIRIADELLAKLRRTRQPPPTTHVDAPQAGSSHGGGDDPPSSGNPDADTLDAPTAVDRTREPYVDPRDDPHGPRRPLDRRELLPHRKLDVKTSWKEIERATRSGSTSFAVGRKLKTAEEGHEILARLARGDGAALREVGIKDLPDDVDSTGREWALIQVRDGFALYAGSYNRVELPGDVRIIGHTHAGPTASVKHDAPDVDRSLRASADGSGLRFEDIANDLENARNAGILPSGADINAISDGTDHVLYTRFVHVGDGRIANPTPGDVRPRVSLMLRDAHVVRWAQRHRSYWYEVQTVVRDSNGKELWSGKLYVSWNAITRRGDAHLHKPPSLAGPPGPGWSEP